MKKQPKWCMFCEHRRGAERHCRIKQTEVDPFGTCKKWKKALTYKQLIRAQIRKVPLATKQQILDLWHGGKNIGQISEAVKLDSGVVLGIINDNVQRYEFIRKESRP